jgi:hypothetical protein
MRLIASRAFPYLGRHLEAGDEFDAEPAFGRVWLALSYATEAPPEKSAPKKREPEPEPPEKPTPDHRYRTRRLKADDD